MSNQSGKNSILSIMIIVALIALALGFAAMYKRTRPNEQAVNQETETESVQQVSTETQNDPDKTPVDSTGNWQTYTNSKYGFFLKHPSNVTAGSISDNSALGTHDLPIKGFHVGPLVFIALKDTELKQEATNYFEATYQVAVNPPQLEDGPSVSCKIDKINNPNVTVRSVSCVGEGGPARYAYIQGPEYDIFVDGYSRGYDDQDNGIFGSETDYEEILASFKF